MQEKLYSMKKELAALLGRDRLLKSAVKEVNKQDMIKASMVIRNAHHEEIDIDKILGGDLQKDLALGDYVYIENFTRLVKVADNCLDMGNYIDKHFLISAYRTLADDPDGYFRKTNPVVYTFNHVPAHALDIEEKLDDAMRRVYRPEAGNNVVLKAMYIHNKLIDIYPFPDFNAEIAVFASELLSDGKRFYADQYAGEAGSVLHHGGRLPERSRIRRCFITSWCGGLRQDGRDHRRMH